MLVSLLPRSSEELDLLALVRRRAAKLRLDMVKVHLLGVLTRCEESREVVLLVQS